MKKFAEWKEKHLTVVDKDNEYIFKLGFTNVTTKLPKGMSFTSMEREVARQVYGLQLMFNDKAYLAHAMKEFYQQVEL